MSARDRIREFLLGNVGRVVHTDEIREIAGINTYARRVRELRDDEGFRILTSRDRSDLKQGEYLLESAEPTPSFSSRVTPGQRVRILERNGYTCSHCGRGPGDPDANNPRRKTRLEIDHEVPAAHQGPPDDDNLRVLCSACNQSRANIQAASETALNLLARIRRQSMTVQREVFTALGRRLGRS